MKVPLLRMRNGDNLDEPKMSKKWDLASSFWFDAEKFRLRLAVFEKQSQSKELKK